MAHVERNFRDHPTLSGHTSFDASWLYCLLITWGKENVLKSFIIGSSLYQFSRPSKTKKKKKKAMRESNLEPLLVGWKFLSSIQEATYFWWYYQVSDQKVFTEPYCIRKIVDCASGTVIMVLSRTTLMGLQAGWGFSIYMFWLLFSYLWKM